MLLTKEFTQQLKKPENKLLENVSGLDRDVLLRPLVGIERVEFYAKAHEAASKHDHEMVSGFTRMVVLVIESVVDDTGKRVYEDGDFDLVASIDQVALMHIADEAQKLNGFDTGELEGNS